MYFSQSFKGIGLALGPKPHFYLDTAVPSYGYGMIRKKKKS
jgi:hypothetical protein